MHRRFQELLVVPEGLNYTREHEWVGSSDADPTVVRVGITDYAQDQLGDVVYVQLPTVGETLTAGSSVAEVESTKSVSEIYAPVDGEVTAVNDTLGDSPELLNSDPYGSGWMFELRVADATVLDDMLDASSYQGFLDES